MNDAQCIVLMAIGLPSDPQDADAISHDIAALSEAVVLAGFGVVPYGTQEWRQLVASAAIRVLDEGDGDE